MGPLALLGLGWVAWKYLKPRDSVGGVEEDGAKLVSMASALKSKIVTALYRQDLSAGVRGKLEGLSARASMLQASAGMIAAGVGNYAQQLGEYNSINVGYQLAMAEASNKANDAPAPAPAYVPPPAPVAAPAPAPVAVEIAPPGSSGMGKKAAMAVGLGVVAAFAIKAATRR